MSFLQGRTGVMICSYLLHNDHFSTSEEALRYYGEARTRNAKGVTIPSQRRYVLYYSHLLTHGLTYTRTMVLLKRLEMTPVPSFQNSTCSKCFVIFEYYKKCNLHIHKHHFPWHQKRERRNTNQSL